MKRIEKSFELGGKKVTVTAGHIAQQADGAVFVTAGETVVMATVVAAPLSADLGYFPLSVEYEEKLYAGGRIKGSRWVKRKGRPSDEEILVARVIDRSIRPLFPENYARDVQVIVNVLSLDSDNPPDMLGVLAVNCAIEMSAIPWQGPIGAVRVVEKDGDFVVNPTSDEIDASQMDLVVSSTKDAVVMIEMGAKEVSEDMTVKAIDLAQKEGAKVVDFVKAFGKEVGTKKEKLEEEKLDAGVEKKVKELTKGKIMDLAGKMATKEVGYDAYDEMKAAVVDAFEDDEEKAAAKAVFEKVFKKEIRDGLLKGKRPDGRKTDQLRDLSAAVAILPRTHGTGLFQRGQTQALSIATLGSTSEELLLETAEGEESKRYIHHYAMPPYSTGETGRVGSPKRREIGHGALAEKAMLPVIPSVEEFPYTMLVETEILSSNGSTSMASVCGSALSLMDAGVPIKAPVAGIAMGVVVDSDKEFSVLTDIVGIEDGNGDMDFKVAGTREGVTALQLDVKTLKLSVKVLESAFAQAKKAREEILDVMDKALDKPRESVSKYAPKIQMVKIATDKIGELIGPGGKTIKALSAETGAEINVDDDGNVSISAETTEGLDTAVQKVTAMTKDVQPGEIYEGIVKRLQNFGAFVEILPGKEGLVHVSDMSEDFVKDPADVVKEGQEVTVRVKEIDDFKRINLSMLLDPEMDKKKDNGGGGRRGGDRGGRGGSRGGSRGGGDRRSHGGGRFNRRDRDNRGGNKRSRSGGGGGPHFPATRLMDMDKKDFS